MGTPKILLPLVAVASWGGTSGWHATAIKSMLMAEESATGADYQQDARSCSAESLRMGLDVRVGRAVRGTHHVIGGAGWQDTHLMALFQKCAATIGIPPAGTTRTGVSKTCSREIRKTQHPCERVKGDRVRSQGISYNSQLIFPTF